MGRKLGYNMIGNSTPRSDAQGAPVNPPGTAGTPLALSIRKGMMTDYPKGR